MNSHDQLRQRYRPHKIRYLLIAESPPPPEEFGGSRHFYRSTPPRRDDRLFTNTIWALYPEADDLPEAELEQSKQSWLEQLQTDGIYMIEALEISQ